jgi:hypothetical protein
MSVGLQTTEPNPSIAMRASLLVLALVLLGLNLTEADDKLKITVLVSMMINSQSIRVSGTIKVMLITIGSAMHSMAIWKAHWVGWSHIQWPCHSLCYH